MSLIEAMPEPCGPACARVGGGLVRLVPWPGWEAVGLPGARACMPPERRASRSKLGRQGYSGHGEILLSASVPADAKML